MKRIFKWLLFISSYVPLYILIALDNYNFKLSPMSYFKSVMQSNQLLIFWVVVICLILLSILAISYFSWISLNDERTLTKLTPLNESVLSYLITYVIPLTAMDITSVNSLVVNSILFLVIGIVYVNSDLVYLNVILIIMGYRIYTDGAENVIITNYSKNDIKISIVEESSLPCREVTKGIYLLRKP